MTESIITARPTMRTKGFKAENLRIVQPVEDTRKVAADLAEAMTEPALAQLTVEDRDILDTVRESYRRSLEGEALEREHFVLSGHELPEYKNVRPHERLRYVVYRYKYNKYPELKIVGEYPPCVQIEPTSMCNYRCVMCYQSDRSFVGKSGGFMGHMSLDLFKKLIDELEGRVEAVTFASRGEPMLNKHIQEMLEYCGDKFLALKMNTNASVLTEKNIHGIFSSGLQNLVFSIDAADEKTYESIRVRGSFKKVVENLKLFKKIRETHYSDSPMVVRVSGVKINDERQDVDELEAFWGEFADIVAFTNYNPWQSSYENEVNEIQDPCTELWRRLFVWWDGAVNPCDYDYKSTLSRWNAGNTSISDVWNSEYYNQLRAHHIGRERAALEPCNRCIVV